MTINASLGHAFERIEYISGVREHTKGATKLRNYLNPFYSFC